MFQKTIDTLLHERDRMEDYLKLKTEKKDWHAVADAAMDLRELEVELNIYRTYEKINQERMLKPIAGTGKNPSQNV